MKALIQRVRNASVSVDNETVASVNKGLLILLGITHSDSMESARKLAEKCLRMRVFDDDDGKMNLSLSDIDADALIVSQFTLYGDCRRGRRPSYTNAAQPDQAKILYEYFIDCFKNAGIETQTGVFGAMMEVELVNSGPVTLMVEV